MEEKKVYNHYRRFDFFLDELVKARIKVWDVISSDADLTQKAIKLEHLLLGLHGMVSTRASKNYLEEYVVVKDILKENVWNGDSISLVRDVISRKRRIDFFLNWFSLMILEMKELSSENNWLRVDFNAGSEKGSGNDFKGRIGSGSG